MTTVGRWSPNKVRARVLDGTWVAPEVLGGMVLLTPTSVDITGGGSETATTLANGSVEFTACASLGLNGVFSAEYDNYMVVIRYSSASGDIYVNSRMTENGTPYAATDYGYQYVDATGTVIGAGRSTPSTIFLMGGCSNNQRSGTTTYFYGPYLAQPTAIRATSISGQDNANIKDIAATVAANNQFDGFLMTPGSPYELSGLVSVYGLVGT